MILNLIGAGVVVGTKILDALLGKEDDFEFKGSTMPPRDCERRR